MVVVLWEIIVISILQSIANDLDTSEVWFKEVVKKKDNTNENLKRYQENCSETTCKDSYIDVCEKNKTKGFMSASVNCTKLAEKESFVDGFRDYIIFLPDYVRRSGNGAEYRVLVTFYNRKDYNNYYSYSTIELNLS